MKNEVKNESSDRLASTALFGVWQPIDRNTEDECLVYSKPYITVATKWKGKWKEPFSSTDVKPTHWMPLPDPPNAEDSRGA